MYSSSTRLRLMMSRRFAITRFQFRAMYQNAFSELCSRTRQQEITTRSRT